MAFANEIVKSWFGMALPKGAPSIYSFVLLSLLASAVGCSSSSIAAKSTSQGTVQIHYAYEMPAKDQEALFKKIKLSRYGEALIEIKKRLGEPTYDRDSVSKEGEFRARVLSYVIRQVDLTGANINDQVIRFYFDRADRLNRIAYSSMGPVFGQIIQSVPQTTGSNQIVYTRPPSSPE